MLSKPGKKKAPKRPTRDEFEMEELGNQLIEAKAEGSVMLLTVWGYEENIRGQITELDSRTKRVHVEQAGHLHKIPFIDIMKVESPRY